MRQVSRIAYIVEETRYSSGNSSTNCRSSERERKNQQITGRREKKIHMEIDQKGGQGVVTPRQPLVVAAHIVEREHKDRDRGNGDPGHHTGAQLPEEAGVPACEQKELAGQASADELEDPGIG